MTNTKQASQTSKTESKSADFIVLGVDVGKSKFDCAIGQPGAEMRKLPVCEFDNSEAGLALCLAWIAKHLGTGSASRANWHFVMEATGRYSARLAAGLLAEERPPRVSICNPRLTLRFAQSLSLRNKTDKTDARMLVIYGRERHPAPWQPPEKQQAELCEVLRLRRFLVRHAAAMKARRKEVDEDKFVEKMQEQMLRQFKKQIEKVDKQIEKIVSATGALAADIALLQTIPGVGFLIAATVRSELGDLRRFERGRALSAFAGLSPRRRESGTSLRGKTRLCKMGNSEVRQMLYLAALTAIRGESHLADNYRRMVAEGKSKMSALGAVMRKLLLLMRAMLLENAVWQPHYRSSRQVA